MVCLPDETHIISPIHRYVALSPPGTLGLERRYSGRPALLLLRGRLRAYLTMTPPIR